MVVLTFQYLSFLARFLAKSNEKRGILDFKIERDDIIILLSKIN